MVALVVGHEQENEQAPDALLGIGEAAAICGVSVDTIRRWAKAGLVPYLRTPSGQRRFRRADVERFLTEHQPDVPGPQDGEAIEVAR